MEKIIITVVGKDQVGIIGRVCSFLADEKINILDLSQTIVSGFFNMMIIADMEGTNLSFDDISSNLAKLGNSMGLEIRTQREEIFTAMHRI